MSVRGRGRGKAGKGAFGDQFAFEGGQSGENSEDPEGGGHVDGRSLAGDDLDPDATFGQIRDDVDQMTQVPAQSVLPLDFHMVEPDLRSRGYFDLTVAAPLAPWIRPSLHRISDGGITGDGAVIGYFSWQWLH